MRYVLGVLGVIVVAFVAVWLLFSRTPSSRRESAGTRVIKLADLATKPSSRTAWTMQGPILGEDMHRSVRITVTPDERRVELLAGYEQSVERSQNFINTTAAYYAFLSALDQAGFSSRRQPATSEPTGVCPLGNRFIYDVYNDRDHVLGLWSTSCASNQGSLAGNAGLIRQLFERQIPEYNKFVQGVRLQ